MLFADTAAGYDRKMVLSSHLLNQSQAAGVQLLARLPPFVTLGLAVALGLGLARLLWLLVPVPAHMAWEPPPGSARAAPAARSGGDLQQLLSAQLFGAYAADSAPAVALDSAPETRLNLVLSGIFAGSRETDSRALIAPQGGEEKPYAIGADVVRGVSLHAIFPDRVVLSRQGNLETLRLDKDAPSSGFSPPLAGGGPGTQNIAVPALAAVREQILQDPAKAAEFIRIQPLSEDGSLRGYRIYPGRDRSIFNSAGLRPGDLVTAVNGIQLNDAQNALQMLNDLSQASSVSLVIERGGQSQTLNVSLN